MEDGFLILRKYSYGDYNQPVYYPGNRNPFKNLIDVGKKVVIEKELDGEITFIGYGEVERLEEIQPVSSFGPDYTTRVHFNNYKPFFPPRIKNKEIRTKLLELPSYRWYGSIRSIPEEIFNEIIDYCSNPNWSLFLNEMSFPPQQISKSIDVLLKEKESKYLEFKSSMVHLYRKLETQNPEILKQMESKNKEAIQKEIATAIVAFLNTKGGTVIVGVDDDGSILGIENDYEDLPKKKDWDGWLLKFRDLADSYFDDKLVIDMLNLDKYVTTDGKTIVRIDVPEGPEPVYLKKHGTHGNETEFYIRTFTSSQKLDDKYIYGYINSKEKWKK